MRYNKADICGAIFCAAKQAAKTGRLYYVFPTAGGYIITLRSPEPCSFDFFMVSATGWAQSVKDFQTGQRHLEKKEYTTEQLRAIA